ncbi:hypothetical protein NEHOM01_0746 [Nematocida homosporus]|uniref:uncharacterized protein n=1 Tax=Nematocida homosporus TaxID=1912981 RepID=UPI00221E8C41|nr:uncharacterized protein NEHOM01_0746 [Nematocida homosporus]KAI5185288.1 hypothetical protein NEHOM01_0746 [Nematocida homosporus]
MEPEVLIIEISGERTYKIFSTGVSVVMVDLERLDEYLVGKVHLFVLIPSNMDRKEIHKLTRTFFAKSKIESISVMYASVAASLALGVQNVAMVSLEYGGSGEIWCSVDLVNRSSLVYTSSVTKRVSWEEGVDLVMELLHSAGFRGVTSSLHLRGENGLVEQMMGALQERGVFALGGEVNGEELEIQKGYHLVEFPVYFQRMMPHNMLPDSNIIYVGAVLTIMINYFEIKEVNTREDFEAGITKHLILN